ncbi:hypothetical protein V6Z11_A11G251600 [Gossypium hirsutum]
MIQHIKNNCGLSSGKKATNVLLEDNISCIDQLDSGYIKGDRTKHIAQKFFFTHDFQKIKEIKVKQISSSENLADLFSKALPTLVFQKLVYYIGMRHLRDLK